MLFIVALAWRLLMLERLARTPLLDTLDADAGAYWAWASLIRDHGVIGANPFFLAPLYPYMLALVRWLVDDSLMNVLRVQAVVGALAVPLLADAVRRITTPALGLVAGVLVAGYGMSVLYGMLVLSECLVLTLGAGLVWLLLAWPWTNRLIAGAAIAGVMIGLMALARATSLVLVIPLAAILIAQVRWACAFRTLAVTAVTVAAVAAPVTVRHLVLFREWIPYTYSFGFNLYTGNGPPANGTFVPMPGAASQPPAEASVEGGIYGDGRHLIGLTNGRQLSPSESSAYWFGETARTVAAQPLRAVRLLAFKAALLLNHREVPQIEDAAVYQMIFGPFGLPLVGTFAFVGTLGLAGAALALRRGPRETALAVYVLALMLSTSIFFVTARYRVHLLPPLLPLAAVALESLRGGLRSQDWRRVGRLTVMLVVAGAVVALPLLPRDPAHDEWSTAVTLGDAWARHSEPGLALEQYDRAVQIDRSGMMRNADTPVGRTMRADAFSSRGEALLAIGDVPGARASYERANELSPNDPQVMGSLGEVCALEGDLHAADSLFNQLGLAPSRVARLFLERAATLDHVGDRDGVELTLRAALALDPHAEAAWVGLVRLLAAAGQPDSALAVLDHADVLGMDAALYAAHRVLIAASAHRTSEASAWRERIPDVARRDPRVRGTLELADRVDR